MFFLCFLIVPQTIPFTNVALSASVEKTTYAKALVGCLLYKDSSLNDSIDNVLFVVPETYFVIVLENVSDKCMKVQYDKYVGYVDSSTVNVATFIPIVKTLENITCDIKETSGTQIWSNPSASSGSVLTTISSGTKNIKYIAFTYGTIPSGGESNLWYYVSYTPKTSSTNVYEGYVYSENVTNLSEIIANYESNPEIINSESEISDNQTIFVSSSVKTVIIAIIAIPIILLISIILYNLIKKIKENTIYKKNGKNIVSENLVSSSLIPNNENKNLSLKNKISDFRQMSFVKKKHKTTSKSTSSRRSYPQFPTYDSEDDLL